MIHPEERVLPIVDRPIIAFGAVEMFLISSVLGLHVNLI